MRARELHDIVHGQEKRLELELGDQTQFVFDVGAHGGRDARRPALRAAPHRQRVQMTRRGGAGRHDFLGVFVAQFFETESAAFRDLQRLRQQGCGVEFAQALHRAQATLAVRKHGIARGLQRLPQTNRRQHILQGAAAAAMHMHVARGHAGQPQRFAQRFERLQTAHVEAAGQQFHAYPQASLESFAQPPAILIMPLRRPAACMRQPDDQAPIESVLEVGTRQRIAAFDVGPACPADQAAHGAVARAIGGQRHEFQPVDAGELRAYDQRQTLFLGGHMGAHHPRQRAFIGECQCAITQSFGLLNQFLGLRSAAQKREIAQGMEFGVHESNAPAAQSARAAHANTPCRYQRLD